MPAPVVRIPPPSRSTSDSKSPAKDSTKDPKAVVVLPPPKTAARPTFPQQEFLEDLDPRSVKEELLAPSEQKSVKKTGDEEDLLAPMPSDQFRAQDVLEDREKSVTPYPRPDFSGPAEKVVPIPTQPAPEGFRGFEPESPGDWNLPEPRRIYPLPKVNVPNSDASSDSSQGPSLQNESAQSPTMPWQSGAYFNSPQFGSLLGDGPSYFRNVPCVEACSFQGYVEPAQLQTPQLHDRLAYQAEPARMRERLNDHYWKFKLARELPFYGESGPIMAEQSCPVPYQATDFAPIPFQPKPLDPCREIETYNGKLAIETQRPWVEWWRPFYTGGMYDPGVPVFSDVNLLTPSFLIYGDYRTGVGVHRNNGQDVRSFAHRLNLDMDLRLTGTERFHLFTGPLDHNGRFTRLDFSKNPPTFEEELDAQVDTAFFEGDLGAITGSWIGDDAPFDLPFTCGLVPLLYQNGIWLEDAIAGFAVGSPWRHNRALNWANYEATFFAGFNQVTSPAFQNDNNAASVYGTAWFIEAYNGYIEADYAYLDDLDGLGRSYHNAAIAYTRRYFGRISNSVRLIGNAGQSGVASGRSADGGLLLVENSLISSQPSTVVPYWNFFAGNGRPQSVARAGNAGGILRNTGINFETDGLTGYPTLNATGANTYGGAVGINILSADFRQQWITEFAALDNYGNAGLSSAAGPEYAIGTRYQRALNNRFIWRMDFMNGWFDNAPDIYGTRTEFRWKF